MSGTLPAQPSSASEATEAPVPTGAPIAHEGPPEIGWIRAILSGLVVLLVGILGGLGGANLILTKALGLTRDARQYLASALVLVVVVVLAWVLRRLQAHGWV